MGKLDLWMCALCEYVYDPYVGDPDNGVEAGTPFLNLPDEWICPVCTAEKIGFVPYNERAEYGVSEELTA